MYNSVRSTGASARDGVITAVLSPQSLVRTAITTTFTTVAVQKSGLSLEEWPVLMEAPPSDSRLIRAFDACSYGSVRGLSCIH